MKRKQNRPKASAKKSCPVEPPIRDPGPVTPVDSEDAAGAYAPLRSRDDTGESDEGVFAQGPLPESTPKTPRTKRRKEALR